ncbi:MAG: hypothetical protein A2W33_02455 [Chloroflexi bacterium RBG_16_52_11]|nr:MAG: hypothetical protein A2W33_02455 [Chloroflexi bacterium RBG_16_52_11]
MSDDAITAVYDFVERAYIRLQAGEVLNHCLDKGDAVPLHNLVEGLVLAGPQSLSVLREIIAEVVTRKAQLHDDRHQIFHKLAKNLRNYGIRLTSQYSPLTFAHLNPVIFLSYLSQEGVTEERSQLHCLRLFQDTQELMRSLSDNFRLLNEIEIYLQDWLWGLIYQSTRQECVDRTVIAGEAKWAL